MHDLVSESVQASVMTQATIAAFQRDSLAPGGRVAGLAVPPPGRRRPEHLGRGFDLPSAETSTAFVERDDSRMVCDDLRSLLSFHTCGGQVASLLILLVPVLPLALAAHRTSWASASFRRASRLPGRADIKALSTCLVAPKGSSCSKGCALHRPSKRATTSSRNQEKFPADCSQDAQTDVRLLVVLSTSNITVY